MSVIISGMNLPEYCYDCPCHNGEYGYCQISKDYIMGIERPAKCPLIPVPPHGRLVDADALMDQIVHDTPLSAVFEKTMRRYLHNAPTIIPAEEEANERT